MDTLLDAHMIQQPDGSHAFETPDQRRREGLRTIASAFKQAARPRPALQPRVQGLPNTVRECLLQTGQVAAARVLDGLLMAGLRAGIQFTERVACEALRLFGIGRRTVQNALKAFTADAQPVFEPVQSPPNPPEEPAYAAAGAAKTGTNCFFVTGANRVKTVGGRPPQHYRMPTNEHLYRLLQVRPSGSDPLAAEDLCSPESYRSALHRAFIVRRPGRHSRRWLAERLGVSVWTSRRYDRRAGLLVEPMYAEQQVFWFNLDHLPLLDAPNKPDGTFLQTPDGQRYPPVRGLAAHLLARRQHVIWKSQGWNYYRLPIQTDELYHIDIGNTKSDKFHKYDTPRPNPADRAVPQLTAQPASISAPPPINAGHQPKFSAPGSGLEPVVCSQSPQNKLSETGLADQHGIPEPPVEGVNTRPLGLETASPAVSTSHPLAERLYQQVRQRTPDHALTHGAALHLVRRYGVPAVEHALELLARRPAVTNAAGFLITVLRGQGRDAVKPPVPTLDEHAAWVERLRQSPYARFYANADHFTDGNSPVQNEQPEVCHP